MTEIQRNLYLINKKIAETCKNFNKNQENVNLIAVSKKQDKQKIIQAINAGCQIFGENYIAEALEKWPEILLQFPNVKLHFIGNLQRNKVKKALDLFDVIETLDNEKLAKEIQKEIAKKQEWIKCKEFFVQVNLGDEAQKGGVSTENLKDFLDFAKNECKLNVTGLMAIPPAGEFAGSYFALLNKLAQRNNLKNLSMGMSSDFCDAIALNSNFLRIGTMLFGKRG